MFSLVPFEEQQLKFNKKVDLIKYYDDFMNKRWNTLNQLFK